MTSDAELIGRSLAGDGQAFMEVIGRTVGHVTVGITYVVTRVNLADIAAGKF